MIEFVIYLDLKGSDLIQKYFLWSYMYFKLLKYAISEKKIQVVNEND